VSGEAAFHVCRHIVSYTIDVTSFGHTQQIWFYSAEVKKPDRESPFSQKFENSRYFTWDHVCVPLGYAGELNCLCGC
jgi:hypothetical protein